MSIRVFSTKDDSPYRQKVVELLAETFPEDYTSEGHDYSHWFRSPFYFSFCTVDENDDITTYCSFLFTTQDTYQKVLKGEIQEHQIEPFEQGCHERPYLYWPTLIAKEPNHTPFLFKAAFKEVDEVCQKWELKIDSIYNIALSPVAARLLKRYHFEEVAKDPHGYPILISQVDTNPNLYSMLPYQIQ